jgi:glycosyltransferase involved in cell wall biosynthesis
MKLLFITWDGPATNYHETLFIPLLSRARQPCDDITLLQFSWGADERNRRNALAAADQRMSYRVRTVRRGRGAVLMPFLLLAEVARIAAQYWRGHVDLIIARSIIPGGVAVLIRLVCGRGLRFIYDADGLSADERIEFGGWNRNGAAYRLFRYVENLAVRRADVVLVRTGEAASILAQRAGTSVDKFELVVNGKDETVYRPYNEPERERTRRLLGIPRDAPVIVYVGSLGPQYLPNAMFSFVRLAMSAESRCHFLMVTPARNHSIVAKLAYDMPTDRVKVLEAVPTDVPRLLAACDLGLALRSPTLSQRAVAPIKVAEYVLCGVPVVFTSGVGDLNSQLGDDVSYGMALNERLHGVVEWFLYGVMPHRELFRERSRHCGLSNYTLSRGSESYRNAIRRVFQDVEPISVSGKSKSDS